MDRVFLASDLVTGDQAVLTGAVRRHLAESLRVREGERFLATDGCGFEYLCEAESVDRKELVARVLERKELDPGPGRRLTLAIAPPRGGRMEIAVEKAVECGVGRIVPLRCSRSVLKERRESSRPERWRRVAQSATAQSGRAHLPEIAEAVSFAEALALGKDSRLLLAHPGLDAFSIPAALGGAKAGDSVTLLVGPEGGFTEEEVEEARLAGALEVSLGPTRLRTETAAIAAVTLVVAFLTAEIAHGAS
jgi:16S rRNA (uracil1498-N3)-methyltransferase